MKLLKFPIIIITVSFVLGILASHFLRLPFLVILIFLSISFLVFVYAFLRAKKQLFQNILFGICCYSFVISLGVFSHYLHEEIHYKNHYSKIMKSENNELRGTITSVIKPNSKYNKYLLKINQCNKTEALGKILLYYSKENKEQLSVGQEIWINKKIQSIQKSRNPYQFDYSEYLEKQNIFHQVFCNKGEIVKIKLIKNFDYYIQNLRLNLRNSFTNHKYDETIRSILDALLLGQRSYMDKETIDKYSKAGVIHILAISGLHIGVFYFFLAFVLKPIEKIKYGKTLKMIAILSLLWLFAFLTGLPASVTRAVTLFTFISIGNYYNQQNNVYNAVAVSALMLLIFNPNFIFDIGFQLSYAAVISILLFQPFYKRCYFTKNKIGIYFIDIILVSLAAQIGVLPLSLYYFNQLPLLFLVANIVVIPLASCILIFGSFTLLLNFIFKPFALLCGKLLVIFISIMNSYITMISKIKNGIVENISFSAFLTILLYLFIGTLIYWIYNPKWNTFRNCAFVILIFQLSFIFIKTEENKADELLVFNSKKSLISIKEGNKINVFTNSIEENKGLINDYSRGTFTDSVHVIPLQNVLNYNEERILIIDSMSIYKTKLKPDVIVLIQSPKINLRRLIKEVKPKVIIADNSNPFYKMEKWKETCEQEKIPFHTTVEKGFYRLLK